jgi:hypothetical protein
MKKITTLSLIVLLGCAAALPAHAQSRILTRPGQVVDDNRIKAVPIRAELDVKTETKAEVKTTAEQERKEKYQKSVGRLKGQIDSIFEKIQKSHDRIEYRAEVFAEKDVDVKETMILLGDAQLSLDVAKKESEILQSMFDGGKDEESKKAIREQMNQIKAHVRESHEALRKSLIALKKAVVEVRVEVKTGDSN